jgi:hypothetical protein
MVKSFARGLSVFDRLEALERHTKRLEINMGKYEELLADFNAATNAVGEKIERLTKEIADAHAKGEAPSEETLAGLRACADHLKALAADPSNPVPEPISSPSA